MKYMNGRAARNGDVVAHLEDTNEGWSVMCVGLLFDLEPGVAVQDVTIEQMDGPSCVAPITECIHVQDISYVGEILDQTPAPEPESVPEEEEEPEVTE